MVHHSHGDRASFRKIPNPRHFGIVVFVVPSVISFVVASVDSVVVFVDVVGSFAVGAVGAEGEVVDGGGRLVWNGATELVSVEEQVQGSGVEWRSSAVM